MSGTGDQRGNAPAADPFVTLDATSQAELVRRGLATAGELVDAAIVRIEAVNGPINAVTHKLYDQARDRAARLQPEGAFAGVPFLIKDLLPVAGAPHTSSCRALANNVAQASPPYAQAFDAAGLIAVGRTNTPEFGLIDTTEPALYGPSRNPWDLTRSTAGSSGGAGAAVAAGMTPMAHASDGGGSIRLPACHNGVFGLKPSRGRNLSAGFPPMPFGLPDVAVDHVLTRSVRDSVRMLSVTEDPDTPLGRFGAVQGPLDRKLRIGLIREGATGALAVPEVDSAVVGAARLCEELGHEVAPAHWPFSGEAVMLAFLDEWAVLAAGAVAQTCGAVGCEADVEHFEPWTLELARRGAALTPERLATAVEALAGATRALAAFFETYDVLLSPVMRHLPKLLGEHATDQPFQDLWDKAVDNVAYTPAFNASGMPAMSVPLHWTAGGLPVGSQFAAKLGGEATLFGLAYQLEAAQPWAGKWAPNSFPARSSKT
ncbi:MAG TPA: amidase family protein [Caulobacteraceae bacterium]